MKNNISSDFLIDTSIPENVYLLGRLWADGNVGKWSVSLYAKEGDIEHIFPFIKSKGIFTIYHRQRIKNGIFFGKPSWSIQISCVWLKNFLKKNDYLYKSYKSPHKILSIIPKKLHHYFWLGFFDGDGCLYVTKKRHRLNFWGTIEQDWTDLINILNENNISYEHNKYIRKNGKHKSSTIEIRKAKCIKIFCDWIYQTYAKDSIGLERKYLIYKFFLDKYENFKSYVKLGAGTGVFFNKRDKVWVALIAPTKQNGLQKNIHIGNFFKKQNAVDARIKKIEEMKIDLNRQKVTNKIFISKSKQA